MAHRTVFVQSALLPRLLAAIGAGSLLAAPGCGGKTQASNGALTDAVDGVEQTSEQQASTSEPGNTSNTLPNNPLNPGPDLPPNPPEPSQPSPGPTTVGTTLDNTSGPTTGLATGETTDWVTILSSGTTDETSAGTTSHQASSEPPELTTEDASFDAGSAPVMCEFGTAQRFCVNAAQMESQARFGVGEIPLDPPRSDEDVAAGWGENGCMKHEWIATGCCNPAEGPGEPQDDGSCCYVACEGACCGRPFLVNGAALLADLVPSAAWLLPNATSELRSVSVELDARARRILGDAWLEDAKMEHASIASFAQFSLDLLRLGAPPELVRDSHLAGLDEIEHARIAFTIAEQLTGTAIGPDAFPLGDLDVHSVQDAIAAAIVEGCIGETLASGVLAEQAQQCTDPAIARHLTRIAEDELRHAELSWRFVAWSIERYGASARAAVEATFASAFAKLPIAPTAQAPTALPLTALALTDEQLRAAGRISIGDRGRVVESVVANVLKPAAATLLARAARLESATPGARAIGKAMTAAG